MRKRIGSQGSTSPEEPMINLMPLIDVVFVVLIVFILAAPLLELDKVELADGPTQIVEHSGPAQNNSPISIHVREDNTILFNGQHVTMGEINACMKRAYEQFPGAQPQLFHDRRAQFGIYQGIKNAAEEAGFKEMDVILKPA